MRKNTASSSGLSVVWESFGVSSSSPHDKRKNCLGNRKALGNDGPYDAVGDTRLPFLSLTTESHPGLRVVEDRSGDWDSQENTYQH